MYSDLLNGEHFFFFSAYDFIASTRKSASSTMRKSRFRVKRTIEIPSKSIDFIYFLFSTRFEQPYFYRAKTFSIKAQQSCCYSDYYYFIRKNSMQFSKAKQFNRYLFEFFQSTYQRRIYQTSYETP